MSVSSHDNGRGKRITVGLGNCAHVLTVEQATLLRDDLTRELGHGTPPALTDREAMVWAVAFARAEGDGLRLRACAMAGSDAVRAMRNAGQVCDVELPADSAAMLAAMTGGGR